MDIPRGHAAMPLQEADFLDFIYNYFKAEYAPIRSFWSTATAAPLQPGRWINMGHELCPLVIRPANAQAQKDLESLDYFTRKWNLDAGFVRGLVIRFAKYEVHERMEKKLFECARLDLMVRKALKEKHVIDALWPSPAPKNLATELLQQGVQVRKWYGDMFNKYFRVLHSIDRFELRPEVDARMKESGTLMLVPFVDHLVFGDVAPILPIVAKGAGYSNAKGWDRKDRKAPSFGEPGRFEIRFDAPSEMTDTYTKSVVRQCQCMKCGTRRDVQVMMSIDPNPNAGTAAVVASSSKVQDGATSAPKRHTSKAAQRYKPGYSMPAEQHPAPREPQPQGPEAPRAASPARKKQCPRCTFLNHPDLTVCEMCQGDLPATTITKPPSPAAVKTPSHSHSASLPAQNVPVEQRENDERPAPPNRHTLSGSLFSIFPFQQQQQQHEEQRQQQPPQQPPRPSQNQSTHRSAPQPEPHTPPHLSPKSAKQPTHKEPPHPPTTPPTHLLDTDEPLSRAPEMAMMPLTPGPTQKRLAPTGLPSNLMDDFVPVSPGFVHEEDEADAGWGEMSREEARGAEEDDDNDEDEVEGRRSGGFIDLDEVAREEAGVWGEREEE